MPVIKRCLYGVFQPYWMVFLSLTFPNTLTPTQLLNTAAPPPLPQVKNYYQLLTVYRQARSPKVPFRIFYLRVKGLGWNISHALKTPQPNTTPCKSNYRYTLQEIDDNTLRHSLSGKSSYLPSKHL